MPSKERENGLVIGRRVRIALVRDGDSEYAQKIRGGVDVFRLLKDELIGADRERFLVLLLDNRYRVLAIEEVAVGSVSQALVHPREVYKSAVLANATALICVHNHPSGDPAPSDEDRSVTRRLKEAGDLLGIALLDHVIIGSETYHSFKEAGELGKEVNLASGKVC